MLSLVRQPIVVATRGSAAPTAGTTPAAPDVEPLALGRADLTDWWALGAHAADVGLVTF